MFSKFYLHQGNSEMNQYQYYLYVNVIDLIVLLCLLIDY